MKIEESIRFIIIKVFNIFMYNIYTLLNIILIYSAYV